MEQELNRDLFKVDMIRLVLFDLDNGLQDNLGDALLEMHAAELAHLLESLPSERRKQLWALIDPAVHGDVLSYLHDEVRSGIIDTLPQEQLLAAAQEMDTEDLVEVLDTLSEEVGQSILDQLEQDHRDRLEQVRSFEPGTTGRLMNLEVVSVREDISVAVVLRYLRRHEKLPDLTDSLLVIDEANRYLGKLDIADVLTANPDQQVSELMKKDQDKIVATQSEHDLLALFERRDLISVAVVDEADQLLGRITVDDAVDLIREEAEHALLKSAGLDEEEDLFSPVFISARRRGVWLGINLLTVLMASWVIGQFSEVLDQIVALAVLMPVVASMGGIAGSQTLTLTIRGLAMDSIAASNVRPLLIKEIGVGTLNGLVWAVVVALIAYLWFNNSGIALIIALALILNLFAGALSGVGIPLILKKYGIDPAISGAVVLTTVTDIIGFLSFLGLASLFLL
jgi:magnesium transporter